MKFPRRQFLHLGCCCSAGDVADR